MLLNRRVIAALGIIVLASAISPPVQATVPPAQQYHQYSHAGYRSRVYTSDFGRLQGLPRSRRFYRQRVNAVYRADPFYHLYTGSFHRRRIHNNRYPIRRRIGGFRSGFRLRFVK
ncbi:hypothetical protein [Chroogloeocystis siderophila]|uniref:Uncharacterized protein n=1 Tax=Chroogloeocystis siderophila 5.2 s.c.1 TaxID=247279 RepID=A0A1U7HX44_9CHRO|nr:hypothetical protein [Chroogloeocystis siderophila]OKH28187.1 hypothetical protein NIES1031_06380 [Chroogloeocystis siderophila 5.2 s.c.1]